MLAVDQGKIERWQRRLRRFLGCLSRSAESWTQLRIDARVQTLVGPTVSNASRRVLHWGVSPDKVCGARMETRRARELSRAVGFASY